MCVECVTTEHKSETQASHSAEPQPLHARCHPATGAFDNKTTRAAGAQKGNTPPKPG